MILLRGEWRKGKSPCTGKCCARPAGKPGVYIVPKHLRRFPSQHSIPAASKNTPGPTACVF